MKTAIFAGSFDPITNGHIDIIEQASVLFDKVIVAVAYNPDKKEFLPVKDRVDLIKSATEQFRNVEAASFDGLTVEYAASIGAKYLIRGVRDTVDFEYEKNMAQINSALNNKISTIFFTPRKDNSFISSSAVREIYANNGDITGLVPSSVSKFLKG